jgi:hypothetical protein
VSWAVERDLLHTCGGGTDESWAADGCGYRVVGCSRSICTLGVVLAWEEADGIGSFALLLVVLFRGSDALSRRS